MEGATNLFREHVRTKGLYIRHDSPLYAAAVECVRGLSDSDLPGRDAAVGLDEQRAPKRRRSQDNGLQAAASLALGPTVALGNMSRDHQSGDGGEDHAGGADDCDSMASDVAEMLGGGDEADDHDVADAGEHHLATSLAEMLGEASSDWGGDSNMA